jgi:hypothetical protein
VLDIDDARAQIVMGGGVVGGATAEGCTLGFVALEYLGG